MDCSKKEQNIRRIVSYKERIEIYELSSLSKFLLIIHCERVK